MHLNGFKQILYMHFILASIFFFLSQSLHLESIVKWREWISCWRVILAFLQNFQRSNGCFVDCLSLRGCCFSSVVWSSPAHRFPSEILPFFSSFHVVYASRKIFFFASFFYDEIYGEIFQLYVFVLFFLNVLFFFFFRYKESRPLRRHHLCIDR